jgi:hypothetical protein
VTTHKHLLFLLLTTVEVLIVIGLVASAHRRADEAATTLVPARRAIATRLGLTDLAIWTEARYTRHPSQADVFSPFQDLPSSLEHFPAGSVVGVPDMSGFAHTAEP